MTFMAILTFITVHGPQLSMIASIIAAMIPAAKMNANPLLKTFNAIIDLVAVNVGHAKEGPTPAAVLSEVVTGTPSVQRDQVDKT